jgi:FixJ family two-component response regulator
MTNRSSSFVIAVVDDDQRILESLKNLLESADYGVRLFSSATALLESDCVAQIDCLISDIGMPGMDGFELSQAVHAARPKLPIILITGQTDMLGRSSPVGSGRYRAFKKPFDGEALLGAVGDALQDRDRHRSQT